MRRLVFASAALAVAGLAIGCHPAKSPELRVIGEGTEVVFVQVKNPASRSMRLTKLDYTFAAEGTTVSQGQLDLERDIPAGQAVVLEVPLDPAPSGTVTLRGTLTAELDQIVRSFSLSAQIQSK
jgi:hypothetical protein